MIAPVPAETAFYKAARGYAELGLASFPCAPLGKIPRVDHGCKAASLDEAQHREWGEQFPNANIGLAMGGGYIAVDVDCKNGSDGLASLRALEARHGPLPKTWTQTTPSGGQHLIFRVPTGAVVRNSAGRLGPGLDVRADGEPISAGFFDVGDKLPDSLGCHVCEADDTNMHFRLSCRLGVLSVSWPGVVVEPERTG